MEDKKETLRTFIFNELAWDRKLDDWGDDQSLLENGIIDSMGMLKLLSFMEETFAIKLSDEDFVPENFETLNCMCNLVEKRTVVA